MYTYMSVYVCEWVYVCGYACSNVFQSSTNAFKDPFTFLY